MGPFAKATIFGLVAAILGAALYYAVIAITNFEIGIVAIAIGYMVGFAVRKGAGGGGRRFQVIAVLLTYWAVGLAYMPLVLRDASRREQQQAEQPGAAAQTAEPSGDKEGGRDRERGIGVRAARWTLAGAAGAGGDLVAARRSDQRRDHRVRHACRRGA